MSRAGRRKFAPTAGGDQDSRRSVSIAPAAGRDAGPTVPVRGGPHEVCELSFCICHSVSVLEGSNHPLRSIGPLSTTAPVFNWTGSPPPRHGLRRECASVPNARQRHRLPPGPKAGLPFPIKGRLGRIYAEFVAVQKERAVKRRVPVAITAERIERALDRVAEIIVAWGDKGESLLPLYDYLERALEEHRQKEERLAAVHQRVKQSLGRTATRSS